MVLNKIVSLGSALPPGIVKNEDLVKYLDTSDEWIRTRTGISQRHIAEDHIVTSDLGAEAASIALKSGGVDIKEIDLILVATTTPDRTFPSTAIFVQEKLGCLGMAMDIHAVCSGFVYGLVTADALLKAGVASCALVIGAETFSRIVDQHDRSTAVLFGDGAGAAVLRRDPEGRFGLLASSLHADGQKWPILCTDGGPSSTGTVGVVKMNGADVFKYAVDNMVNAMNLTLQKAGITIDDVNWVVPHQANKRIIDLVKKRMQIVDDRVIVTIDKHANTSAASIPLALCDGVNDGKIKRGDLVLMAAVGGGLTWGACLLRY